MKKTAILLAAVLCAACFFGCAPSAEQPVPSNPPAVTQTEEPAPSPSLTAAPTPEAAPTSTPTPTPTREPLPLEGLVIGIDPGHQAQGNSAQEPVAPGSSQTKPKVSSGTAGSFTGVPEYQVNLAVGLKLRELLEEQGATVVMTRETNDVDISNIERAQLFNDCQTDYAVRLHCNGIDDADAHGAFVIVPTEHPYLEECERAGQLLIDAFCAETGAQNDGLMPLANQTGFNWCERLIVNIEMGYMSNEQEDYLLTDPDYQVDMAYGIRNGILDYFE